MVNEFMQQAIDEARYGIKMGHGGPFGAVIVKDGIVYGRGHNCVLKDNDPTQHSEMIAIKEACKNLRTKDLTGCDLYCTSEPCPMCFSASLWANISNVYFGCNRLDAEAIGYRDNAFYQALTHKQNQHKKGINRDECWALFQEYNNMPNKQNY